MAQPKIVIASVSNLWSRQMHFESKGDIEYGHKHAFDHLTLLAKGTLEVDIEGVKTTFKAPHMIFIRKDKQHELVALEDNTVAYCIHALRGDNTTEDILDPAMIPILHSGLVGIADVLTVPNK